MADLEYGGHKWDKFVRQWRNEPNSIRKRSVLGYDVESCDGWAFLITCSDGRYSRVSSFESAMDFLTRDKSRGCLNLFWNIDYDISSMLKYLNEDELREIYVENSLKKGNYKIRYIPRKKFSIRDGFRTYSYYDLAQFYSGGLDEVSKKYLNVGKKEIDIDKFSSMEWINNNFEKVKAYCIRDSKLTAKLGDKMQQMFNRIGADFSRPTSLATIAMKYAQSQYPMPHFWNKEYQHYALNTYFGGRFECFKRGYFPDVWKYDLNSAYPYELSKLPDISFGKWKKKEEVDKSADIGFIRCGITTKENYVEPLPARHKELIKFPHFKANEWYITLDEYKFILEHKLADIEVKDGWFWYKEYEEYPFFYMRNLYKKRQEAKEEGASYEKALKIIMNSTYGKFAERQFTLIDCPENEEEDWITQDKNGDVLTWKIGKKTGNYYCPVYASLITSRARLKLLQTLLEHKDNIVATFTDSVFLNRPKLKNSKEFGEWKYEGEGELVLLCSGVYTFRNDSHTLTRLRGIFNPKELNLFDMLKKHRNEHSVKFIRKKVLKLGEVLSFINKWNFDDYNRFTEVQRDISMNADTKRKWLGKFKNCDDMLSKSINSRPLRFL